ncbi:MAG: hypothetical protein QOE96_2880 [Blastocatellia bacterium]|jgi:hypothetical protein|nr:hypothetical protein [Blastocatellia bacterium]
MPAHWRIVVLFIMGPTTSLTVGLMPTPSLAIGNPLPGITLRS